MEYSQNKPPAQNHHLIITEHMVPVLNRASFWAKFLSIAGFITTAFIFLGAISAFVFTNIFNDLPGNAGSGFPESFKSIMRFIPLLYLLMAIIYFIISLYLYRFATHLKQAVVFGQQQSLEVAFGNLKSYLKTIGILVILIIASYAIAIVVGIGMYFLFSTNAM